MAANWHHSFANTVAPAAYDNISYHILHPLCLCRQDKDLLLVSLLDGNLVAVDPGTGRVAWTFDSGLPLVTAKKSEASTSNVNIFPGADGGLYAYHSTDGLNVGLEKLPISLPELVDAAPSLTNDGSVVLGTRQTTLYVLERSSGRLLHVWSNDNRGLEDHASVGERAALSQGTAGTSKLQRRAPAGSLTARICIPCCLASQQRSARTPAACTAPRSTTVPYASLWLTIQHLTAHQNSTSSLHATYPRPTHAPASP